MSEYASLAARLQLRPIDHWPGELTPARARKRSPFDTGWSQTIALLASELRNLNAAQGMLQLAMEERDFRIDGLPRANATAEHPGVILSFNAPGKGRLEFATDVFTHWQDNVRAIALGLEALRKVDRYGVTKGSAQYAGFKQLPSGAHDNSHGLHSRDQAVEFIHRYLRGSDFGLHRDEGRNVRQAIAVSHPDRGGDDETFRKVMRAKELIDG